MSYTNFNGYSHGQLRKMVQAMNSGEVMAASDPWRRAAATLKAIRTSLGSASGEAALDWEGSTSNAFYSRMTRLANSINNTASYANDAAITLQMMAEAIDQAKRDMPEEPGNWDKFTDAVGDIASATVGGDDEDTKTSVGDEKKAEAVAVMQTLAMKYRAAAPLLKPPPPPPPPPGRDDFHDIPAPDDPTGAVAIGAMIAGSGMGNGGYYGASSGAAVPPKKTGGSVAGTPKAPKASAPPPTDPAIKGGTPKPAPKPPAVHGDSTIKGGVENPTPKPPTVINVGPGTGIDGATLAPAPTAAGSSSFSPGTVGGSNGTGSTGPGGLSGGLLSGGVDGPGVGPVMKGGGVAGPGTGSSASGQNKAGGAGREAGRAGSGAGAAKSGNAFGAGGMQEGGFGAGGRGGSGGRSGSSPARRGGGVAGEAVRPGAGRRGAFTEGGSGLGARTRAQGEQGKGPQGQGMPLSDSQRRKKEKEKGGKRPDYLVEDEETWVSGQAVNPNVVE
ncbi:WXG100 family type VII secretion target [Kitasatospora sp. NPDC050543]|uniref:WXG100 family type VII secretion target n=1 Tax=Kitasatospora sp. NPDC050543 TaxID=3364054 RepID=UPI00378C3403